MNLSTPTLNALAKLRPPFARSATFLYPFTNEGLVNPGITVQMPAGEPVVAAGAGTVVDVYRQLPIYQVSDNTLLKAVVYYVVIAHGGLVFTTVAGLSGVNVVKGSTVQRGQRIGTMSSDNLFVAAQIDNKAINPLTLNKHWAIQNSAFVVGQGNKIRFAPDQLLRDLSNGIVVFLHNGIKYFKQAVAPTPFLVNIAFNGDGTKTGSAATGITADDYWNDYLPEDFQALVDSACYYPYLGSFGIQAYDFTAQPVLHLSDYAGNRNQVLLERVAPMLSAANSGLSWDAMLARWIGGYLGPVPYENIFRLRNVPPGTYTLYLYANAGTLGSASTFYVSINSGTPTVLTNNPVLTPAFIEHYNYVKIDVTLARNDALTIKTIGYLSGLQLQRI
jgi:hypothetical protein